jgi:hypothetical protein
VLTKLSENHNEQYRACTQNGNQLFEKSIDAYCKKLLLVLVKKIRFSIHRNHSLNQLYYPEIFISIYGNNNQSYWIGFCLSYCNSFYVSLMSEDNHEEVFTLEISLSLEIRLIDARGKDWK